MVKEMKALARRPVPQALALASLLVLPLAAQEPSTRTIVQPPTGWFGVRISDQAMVDQSGNAFFDSYPVITYVDSGSPASKAGVLPGDVLLTFNSHDMRGGSIQLTKWLKAGSPFVLRIRRNDKTRLIKGILGERPKDWEQNMIVELKLPEAMDNQRGSLGRTPMPPNEIVRTRVRMPAPEPMSVLPPALGYGGGIYPFAGAEFTALNPDLAATLGVKPEGVFVTNVIEGSPARMAGLRGGDVVLKADTFRIAGPIDLVQAIRMANETDQTVVLQVLRKHKTQDVTLRW
jgi:S1-C subfamily serine protease